jgi:hypothetical protein
MILSENRFPLFGIMLYGASLPSTMIKSVIAFA